MRYAKFFRCEWCIPVLRKLYHIIHPLEVCVNRLVHLYWIRQGLPARLKVQHSDIPVPIYEVIHEALGGDDVEPHVPLFFRGKVGFLYHRDDILLESGIYVLIYIVNSTRFLVDHVCIGSFHC